MTRNEFWAHIASLNASGASASKPEPYRKKLVALLNPLSASEVAWFIHWVHFHLDKLRTRRHWCAAVLAHGGSCDDEAFGAFRGWIIAHGEDAYGRVLANPDEVFKLGIPADKDGYPLPQLNALLWTPRKVLDKKAADHVAQQEIWDTISDDVDSRHEEDFHVGWSYWDPITVAELQRDLPALWADLGELYTATTEDEDYDDPVAGFVKQADIKGLGTVSIGDTLVSRHDGTSFVVLGISDTAAVFGEDEYLGGDDFRYIARVQDADGEIRSNQGISGRYQRRPGDPDLGPPEEDDDDSGSGVSDESMALDDAIQARLKAALGDDVRVVYEAYEFDDDERPVDNLDKRAHKGRIRFVAEDPNDGETFESDVLENPTWLDVARVANQMLIALNDHHHVYLEGIDIVKKPKGEPVIAEFSMGS